MSSSNDFFEYGTYSKKNKYNGENITKEAVVEIAQAAIARYTALDFVVDYDFVANGSKNYFDTKLTVPEIDTISSGAGYIMFHGSMKKGTFAAAGLSAPMKTRWYINSYLTSDLDFLKGSLSHEMEHALGFAHRNEWDHYSYMPFLNGWESTYGKDQLVQDVIQGIDMMYSVNTFSLTNGFDIDGYIGVFGAQFAYDTERLLKPPSMVWLFSAFTGHIYYEVPVDNNGYFKIKARNLAPERSNLYLIVVDEFGGTSRFSKYRNDNDDTKTGSRITNADPGFEFLGKTFVCIRDHISNSTNRPPDIFGSNAGKDYKTYWEEQAKVSSSKDKINSVNPNFKGIWKNNTQYYGRKQQISYGYYKLPVASYTTHVQTTIGTSVNPLLKFTTKTNSFRNDFEKFNLLFWGSGEIPKNKELTELCGVK
jgi:hypothetical protein